MLKTRSPANVPKSKDKVLDRRQREVLSFVRRCVRVWKRWGRVGCIKHRSVLHSEPPPPERVGGAGGMCLADAVKLLVSGDEFASTPASNTSTDLRRPINANFRRHLQQPTPCNRQLWYSQSHEVHINEGNCAPWCVHPRSPCHWPGRNEMYCYCLKG
jgi:hypothetical protein